MLDDMMGRLELDHRATLIYALRNTPEEWAWDFTYINTPSCNTAGCAVGLAQYIWKDETTSYMMYPITIWAKNFFGLTLEQAKDIFGSSSKRAEEFYKVPYWGQITPEMVADALEAV